MINIVVLFILVFIGFFVNPPGWGLTVKILFKLALLVGVVFFLYRLRNDVGPVEEEEIDESEEDQSTEEPFFDNKVELFTKALNKEPEVLELLKKQFLIIWNFVLPHNGYLFLELPGHRVRLLHKRVKDDVFTMPQNKPIPVLKLIDNTQGVLIENHVENGSTLLPFYKENTYVPRSFMGFRTDIDRGLHLYWIFDAELADFFNDEDRGTINKINEVTLSYLQKMLIAEHLKDDSRESNKMVELSARVSAARSIKAAVEAFTDILVRDFQASKLTISFRKNYDLNATEGTIYHTIGTIDLYKPGSEFVLEEGLNGWVILKNRPYLLDDIDKGEYFIPRFSRQEKTNYGLRAFLSVPILYEDQAIGAVTLEDETANRFTVGDKEKLLKYTELFSRAINRLVYEKQVGG